MNVTAVTRRLRAARLTVAVAMAAAGLAFAAAPALASSTPNEQETVTCGMGCFNVSTTASIANGNATFSSTGDVITEAFTINDGTPTGDLEFDATIDGTELTASQIGCTDGSATAYPGPSPVTVSSYAFPVTCTVTYSPSATDVQNGYVDTDFTVSSMSDTATTTGTYAFYETGHVPAVSMSHQIATISGPAAASGTEYAAAGESIDYSTTVTNTGQALVDAANVSDSNPAIDYSCPSQTLTPNQSENCTASYTVTQNDVDGGPIDSSATVGVTPTGSQVPVFTGTDDLSLNPSQQPAAALTQTPQVSGFTAASRPITYNENVTNTGNVTLFDPSISNTLAGLLPLRCAQSVLAPGASTTCTQTYITSAGDVAAGSVANTATMTLGTPNSTVSSNPSGSTVPFTGPAAVPPSIYTPPAPVKAPKKPSLTTTASRGDTHLVAQPIGGLTRGKPSVRFAVSVSRHSAKLQQLTVTLPSGLHVLSHRVHGRTVVRGVSVKGAKIRSVALSHGRLVITLRTATSSATISLGSSTLGETRALHTQAQHKKLSSLRFKVAARDTRHHSRTVTVTIRHFLS